jgi:hypothetical protein
MCTVSRIQYIHAAVKKGQSIFKYFRTWDLAGFGSFTPNRRNVGVLRQTHTFLLPGGEGQDEGEPKNILALASRHRLSRFEN